MSKMGPYPRLSRDVTHPLLPGITDRRLNLFTGGHYARQNLSSALDRARVDGDQHVKMYLWSAPGCHKPTFDEATKSLRSSEKLYQKGDWLGPSWTNHWLRVELRIPEEFQRSEEPVLFEFDPGCEAMIYTLDGHPVHAITGGPNSRKDGQPGDAEDRRIEHLIPREAVKAGRYECVIEVSVNGMFGVGLNGFRHQQPDNNVSFQLIIADLVLVRSEARALEIDFQILTQIARTPNGEGSSFSRKALRATNEIMNTFTRVQGDDEETGAEGGIDAIIQRCRTLAFEVLGPLDAKSLQKVYAQDDASGGDAIIWGIGHCHIDTAWLWRYTQTQQKIARSWSTQVDIMTRYPNHHFAASSAQQYAWLEELYPSLFESVKAQIKAGHFHPVGGAWLEHDCVLPSGESLCRHYLYGQRYFQEKFGVRCREAWLPDTFGYASQLPQILRLAGIDYFFTQKLSWNNINVFPYSTFNWIGLDGSQVLSHMTPVDTYNAQCNYSEVVKGATKNKNLGVTDQCLLLFGNGDGGGGPTPRMLEKLNRLESASATNPEMPSVRIGKVIDFFDTLNRKTNGGKTLPTWRGELYFELHRGTFTSQECLKKGNKQMERQLRDLEYYATLASLHDPSYTYPRAELEQIWRDVLLNQFHDVLPGTSIKMVVDDALEIYAQRSCEADSLLEKALSALIPSSHAMNGAAPTIEESVVVLDPLRLPRSEVIKVNASIAASSSVPSQAVDEDSALVFISTDASGVGSLASPTGAAAPSARQAGDAYMLSNAHFELTISHGRVTSLVDLALGRELISAGPDTATAGLMLYEDLPLAYDAWDAEIYHLKCGRELVFDHVEVAGSGPLRASLRAESNFGKSKVILTFSLDAVLPGTPSDSRSWLRVDVYANWHEKHQFLKFALPIDIHSPNATYGTQYGLIDRPTHRNTTQEQAKFEVCAHMLGDLSEAGYGVTIASDYKYGYAVEGNTMRLSLLRSATAPDPTQDEGEHDFSFAIMPHVGRFLESGKYKEAMRFTNYVRVRTASNGADSPPWALARTRIGIEGARSEGVILDAVKRGEDDEVRGEKTVIMRMYESLGGRAKGDLTLTGLQPRGLQWVNILEEPMTDEPEVQWEVEGGVLRVALDFRGFEVKTLKVALE